MKLRPAVFIAQVGLRVSHSGRATIQADEASRWDNLEAKYLTRRVNHWVECSGVTSTNMAESFFSRLRRAEIGTHHHITGKHLAAYATGMVWREDTAHPERRAVPARDVVGASEPASRQWKDY